MRRALDLIFSLLIYEAEGPDDFHFARAGAVYGRELLISRTEGGDRANQIAVLRQSLFLSSIHHRCGSSGCVRKALCIKPGFACTPVETGGLPPGAMISGCISAKKRESWWVLRPTVRGLAADYSAKKWNPCKVHWQLDYPK